MANFGQDKQAQASYFTLEVDERIAAAGVTALFGPSGSGKTPLLRAIAGFERPIRGRIVLGDRVFFDAEAGISVPPHERPMGARRLAARPDLPPENVRLLVLSRQEVPSRLLTALRDSPRGARRKSKWRPERSPLPR